MQLAVSTDLKKLSNSPLSLTFLVVDGPNNLIGRHALARMWPNEFASFKQTTCSNFVKPYHDNSIDSNVIKANKIDKQNSNQKSKNKSKPIPKPKSSDKSNIKGTHSNPPVNPSGKGFPAKNARALEEPVQARPLPPPPSPTPAAPDRVETVWPSRRKLPQLPEGDISQEIGEIHCKKICAIYSEVFNGEKGNFKGAEAIMNLKPGGLEQIKKSGVRPPAKCPYGLEDQFEKHLDILYEDLEIVDGTNLITASQIVPVIDRKNGQSTLKRLAINYKSTINPYLEEVSEVFTSCAEELAKCAGEF